jgi:hypothetical protein
MNLFRKFNQLKHGEEYRARARLLEKLGGKHSFSEDEVNEVFAYKRMAYHNNPDSKKLTQKAFSTPDLAERFRLLRRLNGVGIILASTLMMFQNPHKYAEVNHVSWSALRREFGFKSSEKDERSDYGIQDYTAYMDALKSIADEYGMNVSDVEYVLSSQEAPAGHD